MRTLVIFICCITSYTFAQSKIDTITISDNLYALQLSEHVYVYVSQLMSPQFGRVPCNGLLYIQNKEALFIDTPPTEKISEQLLEWVIQTFPDTKLKAVIVNHFHADCLGGLKLFHKKGIASYAHSLTPDLLKASKDTFDVPKSTFNRTLALKVGGKKVINYYPGEAHTRDNIVTWLPDEKILFGGCMVKALKAGKGNLADANVKEWANTIRRVKQRYQNLQLVIPGHGDYGGKELLEYTIEMFHH